MMSRIATIAAPTLVAMAVPALLSSPASAAADCAQPGEPITQTINHEAVTAQHAAQTHPEWLWSRVVVDQPYVAGTPEVEEVSHPEFKYSDGDGAPEGEGWWKSGQQWTIEDVAAYTDYGWMRHVVDLPFVAAVPERPEVSHEEKVVDQEAYDEKVLDVPAWDEVIKEASDEQVLVTPATEAVYEIEHKFVKFNDHGKVHWSTNPNWNAENNDHSHGWIRTNETRNGDLIEPAHDAVYKTVHHDAVIEHHEATYKSVHHDEVFHMVTVVDSPYVPGTPERAEVSHDEFGWTRSNRMGPEGEGWFLTGQSYDHDAVTHLVREWMRKVIDQPYVPADPEILEQSHTEATDETSVEAPGRGWVAVEGSEVLVEDKAAYTETVKDAWVEHVIVAQDVCESVNGDATAPGAESQPAAHVTASQQVLPNTGSPAWLGAAGLAGAVLTTAGVLVLRRARVKPE